MSQCNSGASSIAPDLCPITTPFWKTTSVGMLLMENRPASSVSISVLTLATRTDCSSSFAARSRIGDIILQGPHQGAQKSTRTGISELLMCRLKFSFVSSNVPPVKSAFLHTPHTGCSPNRAMLTRFAVWQCGQTILFVVAMMEALSLDFANVMVSPAEFNLF